MKPADTLTRDPYNLKDTFAWAASTNLQQARSWPRSKHSHSTWPDTPESDC
jgi:hypothetical protein